MKKHRDKPLRVRSRAFPPHSPFSSREIRLLRERTGQTANTYPRQNVRRETLPLGPFAYNGGGFRNAESNRREKRDWQRGQRGARAARDPLFYWLTASEGATQPFLDACPAPRCGTWRRRKGAGRNGERRNGRGGDETVGMRSCR